MKKRSLLWLGTIAMATGLTGCLTDPGPGSSSSAPDNSSSVASSTSSDVSSTPSAGIGGGVTIQGGYSTHVAHDGDPYYETVAFDIPGFDRAASLKAFEETLYPHLQQAGCAGCHNSEGIKQAPYHSDSNVEVAHEAALTKINPYHPETSRFVERLRLDRHNCPGSSCSSAADAMQDAVEAWTDRIRGMLPSDADMRGYPAGQTISESTVEGWINADKQSISSADQEYMVYTSLHELHNEGLSGYHLNLVRMAVSKALNTNARWAPELVHPTDVTGEGILYRFDIRDYWGYNQGATRLYFGGSDDDLAFGNGKMDYLGNEVNAQVQSTKMNLTGNTVRDPAHAKRVWQRVLHGNVEGAVSSGTIPPYIDGFHATSVDSNRAGEYIKAENLKWVEASQLVYTLTRPDVFNAINVYPYYADEFERNIGVDNSQGMDSYDYIIVKDAITVDSRLLWRAKRNDGGWYYKSYDVFSGQLASGGDGNIFDVYKDPTGRDIRFPWWANPIPKFVEWKGTGDDNTHFSHLAALNQAINGSNGFGGFIPSTTPGCNPADSFAGNTFKNCRNYTGKGGFMQGANEIIYDLPNGLQSYYLTGGENQRRVDAFTLIVRDPRVITDGGDDMAYATGYSYSCSGGTCASGGGFGGGRVNDPRLNIGHSCIGCHADGMNRMTNDIRIGLDDNPSILPTGEYGVDSWINNQATVARVKELYPTDAWWQDKIEEDRHGYLEAVGKIKDAMFIGNDKNAYGEPIVWTAEYVQREKYRYPQTRSN